MQLSQSDKSDKYVNKNKMEWVKHMIFQIIFSKTRDNVF